MCVSGIFLSADWSREATRPGAPASTQVPETTEPPHCMGGRWGIPGLGGAGKGQGWGQGRGENK